MSMENNPSSSNAAFRRFNSLRTDSSISLNKSVRNYNYLIL